ncbi:BLOC-1-related complex subunit 6 [Plutella xylostella]|uniref:BLOC-1-related complex subunit 6 n=1 Tax=Plutella xylostella TaxID=51655 RepID=UPI0020328535|nr:BLOC-1-related complex subunit 6 [Plutella xylostella]
MAEKPPIVNTEDPVMDMVNEKFNKLGDIDDDNEEVSAQMTASYSEISFHSDPVLGNEDKAAPGPSRPYNLPSEMNKKHEKLPLDMDGHVRYEGDMTHYVADDLEFKIKLSSPITKKGETPVFGSNSASRSSTPGKLYRQILAPQIGQIDITVLNDLEYEAQRIAQSVDNLIENLSSILHSNSSLTAENMEVYKDAVGKTCDAMDNNIKSMYTILAKGEEVSQAMVPVQAQAARIAEIKRLLQIFENNF